MPSICLCCARTPLQFSSILSPGGRGRGGTSFRVSRPLSSWVRARGMRRVHGNGKDKGTEWEIFWSGMRSSWGRRLFLFFLRECIFLFREDGPRGGYCGCPTVRGIKFRWGETSPFQGQPTLRVCFGRLLWPRCCEGNVFCSGFLAVLCSKPPF